MANGTKAKIYTADELDKVRYKLPQSWLKAAGLLRHKKIDPVKYQKKVRQEWGKRLRKLEKQ